MKGRCTVITTITLLLNMAVTRHKGRFLHPQCRLRQHHPHLRLLLEKSLWWLLVCNNNSSSSSKIWSITWICNTSNNSIIHTYSRSIFIYKLLLMCSKRTVSFKDTTKNFQKFFSWQNSKINACWVKLAKTKIH